jgi:hypothetical protein
VFNQVSLLMLERAGTAASKSEEARVMSFMPAYTDNAEQIKDKLVAFQQYLQDLETGTKQPRTRADNDGAGPLAGGAAPAAPGAPPAALPFTIPEDINSILSGLPGSKP